MKAGLYYFLYRNLASKLPVSYEKFGGISKKIRYRLAKKFVRSCGKDVNFEHGAKFGSDLEIGDYSGIGINAQISRDVVVGKYVMMAPDVVILTTGHAHSKIDCPMQMQGHLPTKKVTVEDDVWIGQRAIILPGVTIGRGSIVGAGSVVTKSFPPYSIIGGNPAKLLKSRITEIHD